MQQRRSPRLQPNDATCAAGPASLPLPQPETPHHPRTGAALDTIVRALDDDWQLGLRRVRQLRSPLYHQSTADKTYAKIQRLFYSARPALDEVIGRFNKAAPSFPREARLDILNGLLKSQTLTPSRVGTPVSARNVPPKSQLSVNTTNAALFSRGQGGRDSHYTTAPDGSPTDEDDDEDDEYETPPSNDGGTESSPKLTRMMKDKQPASMRLETPSLFKKPSLDMAKSFQAAALGTTTTSANTSFNASLSSSQQTRADTVNTSFTSYDGAADAQDSKMARMSSTTMGSLDDHDLLYVGTKLEFQLIESQRLDLLTPSSQTRESTSTYGSIDDSELVAATNKLEQSAPSSTSTLFPTLPLPESETGRGRSPQKASHSLRRSQSAGSHHTARQWPDGAAKPIQREDSYESPSKIAWYIRELPAQNLFVDRIPGEYLKFPFFVLFVCCRLSEAHDIPMPELLQRLDPTQAQNDPDTFWNKLQDHPTIPKITLREPVTLWTAARKSFEGFSFKGKLLLNSGMSTSKHTSVFRLELLPLQSETSCQLQRQFGSDRFLYLTVPPLGKKSARFDYDQSQQIQKSFHESWLLETHYFLGRYWRVFHIQPAKKKGVLRRDRDDAADMRLVLFATEGIGIDTPLSIGQMLNQFIPFKDNENQSYCKALARVDLGLSKTTPTITFKPSQIRRIRDTYSDGIPEATGFNDPNLPWPDEAKLDRQVMNDGCSRISVCAVMMIWKQYKEVSGTEDPLPSAMQGRIGGAKGIWMISGEPQTRNQDDLDIWIEVTDSQLKFEPPWEDRADDRPYSRHRLTFNLLKYSHPTGPTDLHISFIPIMVDRGVLQDIIAKFMTDQLEEERTDLIGMLSDPVKLHNWIMRNGAGAGMSDDVRWQAALPLALSDKIKLLLRSGFHPEEAPYLAYTLGRFLRQRQTWLEQKLRAPLGKATFMYGVADPSGVLQPGEVHIQFSTPFADNSTGASYRNLNGIETLIARQPACRRSDIQKVRVVCRPELSHLVDVVVFPVKGRYPLAGKLQGGDYDGDIFWTCWEDCLVGPFRNAPAPMQPLDPSKYGIKTDRRRLHEVMNPRDLSTVHNLLKEAFKFRTAPSLLGKATNFLEKVSYQQNRISSPQIDALCDVHDLLVDAPKQAYSFTDNDFTNLTRYVLKCGNPKKPAYKEAMEANARIRENDGGRPDTNQQKVRHRRNNILDYLFFDVFQAHNIETMVQVHAKLSKEEDDDSELRRPYLQLRETAGALMRKDLDDLAIKFADIRDKWNGSFGNKPGMTADTYCQILNSVYESFRALLPMNVGKPDIAPLLHQYFGPSHPVTWETIRASALYCAHPRRHAFVWHMAGRELARLKARSLPGTHDIVAPIFANMKPKPIRAPKPEDEDDDEPSEDEFESAMESIT
ncbi:RNA-directed RNA polymerase 2 [Setomelanomma holmii]|uniref:RNA-dependent RNA polymerase n=1 Tax=Setomelanomma holmii TaxID=210430 RepID=A0A9P4H3V2_9PLEO|nr:RNA-directed RNA polymerase 2 [Setomelanomma holmii]